VHPQIAGRLGPDLWPTRIKSNQPIRDTRCLLNDLKDACDRRSSAAC
jgi:hypothetical protein